MPSINFVMGPDITKHSTARVDEYKKEPYVLVDAETPPISHRPGELMSSQSWVKRIVFKDRDSFPEALFQSWITADLSLEYFAKRCAERNLNHGRDFVQHIVSQSIKAKGPR